jgi:beta-carotene 3-hydroxylase
VGRFEANDALSALHAPLAILAILFGCRGPVGVARELAFGVGLGMSVFGLAYVVVHDGLVHRRLPVAWLARVPYLRDVARAHRIHHAGVYGGPPYGLFFGPLDLARRHRLKPPPMRSAQRRAPTSPRSTGRGPG